MSFYIRQCNVNLVKTIFICCFFLEQLIWNLFLYSQSDKTCYNFVNICYLKPVKEHLIQNHFKLDTKIDDFANIFSNSINSSKLVFASIFTRDVFDCQRMILNAHVWYSSTTIVAIYPFSVFGPKNFQNIRGTIGQRHTANQSYWFFT